MELLLFNSFMKMQRFPIHRYWSFLRIINVLKHLFINLLYFLVFDMDIICYCHCQYNIYNIYRQIILKGYVVMKNASGKIIISFFFLLSHAHI